MLSASTNEHMKYFSTYIFALFLLTGCNNNNQQQASTQEATTPETTNPVTKTSELSAFELYVSTLEQIPLPLNHNPLGQLPELSNNYDKNGFANYKHVWTSQPLGIYFNDGETIGIIDCSIGDWGLVPFLTIYDKQGNKIDSTSFYKKSGGDMGYQAIEYLTLEANRHIIVLDTVKRWNLNEDESDIIENSMQQTIGRTEYQVLTNGMIEKQ